VPDDVQIVLAFGHFAGVEIGGEDVLAGIIGPASTQPSGLTMTLPPRIMTVAGSSPCTAG